MFALRICANFLECRYITAERISSKERRGAFFFILKFGLKGTPLTTNGSPCDHNNGGYMKSKESKKQVAPKKQSANDDVAVPFEESEWFKSLETTPGEMIVANRDLRNWSQVTLAEKLGIQVQNLCAMENGRRTVSRKMAVKLGEVFGTDPAAFFDFGK